MGVDGITILGVAGEAHKLTSDERRVVTSAALDAVADAAPVIVGVSHDHTDDVITAAQDAQRAALIAPRR
jgi:4-hydroxy-tetrahydrodipicolinate synthase